ncbi:hypothetical protein BT69DRAFT_1286223, partial [Atractiella rhizophila]
WGSRTHSSLHRALPSALDNDGCTNPQSEPDQATISESSAIAINDRLTFCGSNCPKALSYCQNLLKDFSRQWRILLPLAGNRR